MLMWMMYCLGGTGRGLNRALTLAMREEVVSERGGGAGVIISGAHTVTAEGGTELLHACQSLCRQEGRETGRTTETGKKKRDIHPKRGIKRCERKGASKHGRKVWKDKNP